MKDANEHYIHVMPGHTTTLHNLSIISDKLSTLNCSHIIPVLGHIAKHNNKHHTQRTITFFKTSYIVHRSISLNTSVTEMLGQT